MAINSSWVNLINNTTEAYSIDVNTFDDLHKGMSSQGIKSNSKTSDRYHNGPIVKTISASSSVSGQTSTTASALVNVKMVATSLPSKIVVQTFIARSTDANGNLVKTGVLYFTDIEVIAGVAAACGYSIGWNIATDIARWLIQQGFDWGSSAVTSVEGRPQPLLIGDVSGKTYIEENLFERLVIKLNEWGLWNITPGSYTPSEPVIGTTTTYNFTGRFPNIPSKYVDQVEALINKMINSGYPVSIKDTTNLYITWAIYRDEIQTIQVWDTNRFNFEFRSPKMNGGTFHGWPDTAPASQKDITFTVTPGSMAYMYNFLIKSDGTMMYKGKDTYYQRTNFRLSSSYADEGMVYDNFGTYRPIEKLTLDDGSFYYALGAPTDDMNTVSIDPNAEDLRHGSISSLLPNWYANRILVSTPDLDQPFRDTPAAGELNWEEQYVPLTIPGRSIDTTSTQASSITGNTNNDLVNQAIKDTPAVSPRIGVDPNPVPTTPPSINPTVPTFPEGVNNAGLVNLYKLTVSECQAFHAWLWSFDFSTFSKFMGDPMQAVIGFHAIFADPTTIQNVNSIYVGNVTASGKTATTIKQFAKLSCGAIYVQPYFKNINDIVATTVQLYLPFIGFVDIATEDLFQQNAVGGIEGKYLYVDYNIDFLTGACLALVSTRDSLGDTNNYLYQFAGNCAVEIPLTSANYVATIRNMIGSTAALAQGNVVGALESGLQFAAPVERSGSCGANAGSMGPKKPYLVITRKVSYDADNRKHFEGLPQNMNVKLGAMSGYTRVKFMNLDGLTCTEEEKADILSKLQAGVFI